MLGLVRSLLCFVVEVLVSRNLAGFCRKKKKLTWFELRVLCVVYRVILVWVYVCVLGRDPTTALVRARVCSEQSLLFV